MGTLSAWRLRKLRLIYFSIRKVKLRLHYFLKGLHSEENQLIFLKTWLCDSHPAEKSFGETESEGNHPENQAAGDKQ
ncbi:MAG: hypothetical protein GX874_02455 [Smithella sp.]|nr:hypothetical protein [Smithella sp.]